MDVVVDHYVILGLPSGEEGFRVSEHDINRAYRSKAKELHPDKRRNDPLAHVNFVNLQKSYEILRDETARKAFDDSIRVQIRKRKAIQIQSHDVDSKRRKLKSDLEERERSATAAMKARREEEEERNRIARQLKDQIAKTRAMHTAMKARQEEEERKARQLKDQIAETRAMHAAPKSSGRDNNLLDKEKVLVVSWEKMMNDDYTAQQIRELFEEFGNVEDVMIRNSREGSAVVVMASKVAAMAATRNTVGV